MELISYIYIRSGYVSEHRNPVPRRYRSDRQLFLIYYGGRACIVVIFGLKVEGAFDSFEEVQMKIKEVDNR